MFNKLAGTFSTLTLNTCISAALQISWNTVHVVMLVVL